MATNEVVVKVRAQDNASGAIGGIKGALKSIPVPAVAAVAAVAGIGVVAFKVASDFDQAFNTIRLGTGATGEVLDGLKNDFKSALSQVPDDMATVATATADLNTRLGLTGQALTDTTVDFLDFARAAGIEVADAVRVGTRAFGDWAIATEDQEGAMNTLFKTAQATGIGVDTLADKVVNFGAPMRQFGFSFEEATALLGSFEKEGVNTDAILGALKIGVAKFAEEGLSAAEGLEGFIEQIEALGPGADATSLAIEKFGSRAGPDMVAAVLEGRFAIEDLVDSVAASGETFTQAAEDTLTLGDRFDILKNKALVAAEPVLTDMLEGLEQAMIAVTPWLEENIPIAIDMMKEKWVELEPHMHEFVRVIREDVVPVIQTILEVVETVWPAIKVIIEENIGHWIAKITYAFETIANIFRFANAVIHGEWGEAWDALKAIVTDTWDFILGEVQRVLRLLDFFIGDIMREILATVTGAWSDVYNAVRFIVVGTKNFVTDTFGELADAMFDIGKAILEGLKDGMADVWQGIENWVNEKVGWMKSVWESAFSIFSPSKWFHNIGEMMMAGLREGLEQNWDAIMEFTTSKGDDIKGAFDGIGLAGAGLLVMRSLEDGLEAGWARIQARLEEWAVELRDFGAIGIGPGSGGTGPGLLPDPDRPPTASPPPTGRTIPRDDGQPVIPRPGGSDPIQWQIDQLVRSLDTQKEFLEEATDEEALLTAQLEDAANALLVLQQSTDPNTESVVVLTTGIHELTQRMMEQREAIDHWTLVMSQTAAGIRALVAQQQAAQQASQSITINVTDGSPAAIANAVANAGAALALDAQLEGI